MSSANKFLESLINYERVTSPYYNFKLSKFRRFLNAIGNPQQKISNVILIAGTKGKGSTASFIESGLRACGLKTGLFTSPHIHSLRERIKISGQAITQRDLDRLINKIKPQVKRYKITFFEAVTAIAFLYFLEKKIDYTILEVGLGGRLDATNVVKPKVSVITRIGYDHTNILGKILVQIAKEKAGIIHAGSYVVLSPQRPAALKAIKAKIRATKTKYYETAKELNVEYIKFNISGSEFMITSFCKFKINLLGRHQIENATTALGVLDYLKKKNSRITDQGIKNGFKEVQIPARCQIISRRPLIMIDGAHNPESAQALYDVIHDIIKRKAIVIFGSSQGKLIKEMFKILAPVTKEFILTQSKNPRHIPSSELAETIKSFKVPFTITKSVNQAIKLTLTEKNRKTPMVITGSFYVASEALKNLAKQ